MNWVDEIPKEAYSRCRVTRPGVPPIMPSPAHITANLAEENVTSEESQESAVSTFGTPVQKEDPAS